MYNPAEVLTRAGLEEHRAHLFNMKQAIFYLTNIADDLHIESSDKGRKSMDIVWIMKGILDGGFFAEGDGEQLED